MDDVFKWIIISFAAMVIGIAMSSAIKHYSDNQVAIAKLQSKEVGDE